MSVCDLEGSGRQLEDLSVKLFDFINGTVNPLVSLSERNSGWVVEADINKS